jgi:mannan endo-1,4-beta-mannosidase
MLTWVHRVAPPTSHPAQVARHGLFFKDPDSKQIYKNHARFLATRNNSINGRMYREDPTIIAW